jgi:hypothetical protein
VHVKGLVCVLDCVRALHLNQFHGVALDSEVEGILNPNIADPVFVGFASLHGEQRLILAVALGRFAIDEDTVWPTKGATTIQEFLERGVTLSVPVANKDGVVIFRISIRDRNEQTAVHAQATEGTSYPMHVGGGVVDVASNLVLDLEVIGVVRPRLNRAHGSKHSILPRVLPILDAAPAKPNQTLALMVHNIQRLFEFFFLAFLGS